jgi:hypothetical protein
MTFLAEHETLALFARDFMSRVPVLFSEPEPPPQPQSRLAVLAMLASTMANPEGGAVPF